VRFQPKTEEQIRADGVLPEGDYDFEVAAAEDTISKAGNDMIALKLKVFAPDGGERQVRDWLVANVPSKVRGFCEATGLLARYDAGELEAHDLEGRTGRLRLKVEGGEYAGNKVAYYKRPNRVHSISRGGSGGALKPPPRPPVPGINDEIPFRPF
jgi:hypothetical protein